MNCRTSPARHPLSFALASVLLAATSASVCAQEATAPQPQEEEAAKREKDANATNLDTVTVTGSRISRDTFNSVSPVQVVKREAGKIAGVATTTGVLQGLAVTAGSEQINSSFGGYVVDGGGGVNTLSLRGLGPNRTLTLLNGRRMGPAGSRGSVGAVDLNTLPNIIVDRVEILKDGASSIYGSDTVAGVANIITRTKIDAPVVEMHYKAPADSGGEEFTWAAAAGTTHDNWWLSGSIEFFNRAELTIGDRDWSSKCPRPLWGRDPDTGAYGRDDWINPATGQPGCWGLDAGGVTMNTIGTPWELGRAGAGNLGYYGTFFPGEDVGMPPGMDFFNRWRPRPGTAGASLADYEGVDAYGRDTFDRRMLNESLSSPTTNVTGFLQGARDLNALGNAEMYFDLLAHRRESRQTGYRQFILDYPTGSMLLPEAMREFQALAPPEDGTTNGLPVGVRAFIGFGNDKSEQNVNFFRFTGGLRGDIGSEWNYDFFVGHSRSDADYSMQAFLSDRLAKSKDVVTTANGFACRDTSDGCVAAPALTPDIVGGRLPADYINYVFRTVTGDTLFTETTGNVTVEGPLFDLPFGTVSAAVGAEYRRSKIDDSPDANSVAHNLYGLTSSEATRGKDATREIFAEVEIPLLAGLPGAQELTANASWRFTDYNSYGADTTYKIGLLYTPVSWLSLRLSQGTSFRAPSLYEQYLGATTGFIGGGSDPCEDWAKLPEASNVRANCESEKIPNNFSQMSSITVAGQGGKVTGIEAETSKARTVGIVLKPEFPSWFGDLSLAADWFQITLDNSVAQLSGGSILDLCYGSLKSDFDADNGWCRMVTRFENNTLYVTQNYINIASNRVRGWDFTARYIRDIGLGEFQMTANMTNFMDQSGRTFPGDPMVNYTGNINSPQKTGVLQMSYEYKKWSLWYGLEWIDDQDSYAYYAEGDADALAGLKDTYQLHVDDYYNSHASLTYKADKWTIIGGIRNIADRQPPKISTGVVASFANAPLYSGYDYLGRSYFLTFTKEF